MDSRQVLLLPAVPRNQRKANALHLILDGVEESPFLQFTENINCTDDNVVWVLDLLVAKELYSGHWCDNFAAQIHQVQQLRQQKGLRMQWPIAVVDNRDSPYFSSCEKIGQAVGDENVVYSYRALVKRRRWDEEARWVKIGETVTKERDFPPKYGYRNYHYRQRPIGVRTDMVASIEEALNEQGKSLCDPIEALERPIDVSYFWDFANYEDIKSNLRDEVYQTLEKYSNETNLEMLLGVTGERAAIGRKRVSGGYVAAMLESKIVIVTQRDGWEDHYRLFEAIVSGALVFTDKMLSLPKGLEHGDSVVEYNSAEELLLYIDYYLQHEARRLQMARKARFVALSQHRSWQHMEEIVFGDRITDCSGASGGSCPYSVHANGLREPCSRSMDVADQ